MGRAARIPCLLATQLNTYTSERPAPSEGEGATVGRATLRLAAKAGYSGKIVRPGHFIRFTIIGDGR